ncbi:hypothetical protein H0X06_01230 [Candidatus Dependentiae bacterium]|nr:hypothetical protein [Candidatus Dependentiae bacterium]
MNKIVALSIVLLSNVLIVASEKPKPESSSATTKRVVLRAVNPQMKNQYVFLISGEKLKLFQRMSDNQFKFIDLSKNPYNPAEVESITFSENGSHVEVQMINGPTYKYPVTDIKDTGENITHEEMQELTDTTKEPAKTTPYISTFEKISPPKSSTQPEQQASSVKTSQGDVGPKPEVSQRGLIPPDLQAINPTSKESSSLPKEGKSSLAASVLSDIPSAKSKTTQGELTEKKLVSQQAQSRLAQLSEPSKRVPLGLIYSPEALKKIQETKRALGEPITFLKMAISDDATKIATLDSKGLVQVWDGQSGDIFDTVGRDLTDVQLLKFSDEGNSLIMTTPTKVFEYTFMDPATLDVLEKKNGAAFILKNVSKDKKRAVTLDKKGNFRGWNLEKMTTVMDKIVVDTSIYRFLTINENGTKVNLITKT